MTEQPFITLDHITVRLRERWLLEDTCWQIRRGENWVIWGPNGAGKSTLATVLTGQAAVVKGAVVRHYQQHPHWCGRRPPVALFSSEQYHRLYQRERFLGEMRQFAGRGLETTLAGDLLSDAAATGPAAVVPGRRNRILDTLHLESLLPKPLMALSSGQMRKLLLGRALLADACLLILDEPFNGLDGESRRQLNRIIAGLAAEGTQMVLVTHRLPEIPDCFQHVLQMAHGRVVWQGAKAAFLSRITDPHAPTARDTSAAPVVADIDPYAPPLIRMRDVSVRFGDQMVLDRIDWTVRQGEHWALIGPNGAGKSTLLELISGDQLQAYANDISLFGRARGSGETLWEVKQHIGHIDDVLQARYQRRMTGFDVICSGFFDSVGLYRHCTDDQRRIAHQWVRSLEIDDLTEQRMAHLSFGQQRLILIARAVVKSPPLLILDEPCNGLDPAHRARLLDLLDRIGLSGGSQLLYVSHRPDEIPACITHRLYLESGKVVGRDP